MNEMTMFPVVKRKRKPAKGFVDEKPKTKVVETPDWKSAIRPPGEPKVLGVTDAERTSKAQPAGIVVKPEQTKIFDGKTVTMSGPKDGAKTNVGNNNSRNRGRGSRGQQLPKSGGR